jgi:hypothetical protein
MKFGYQAKTFSDARSSLMLPHAKGEADSIANAFHECSLGLNNLSRDSLDDYARGLVLKLEALMDTSGLKDPSGEGLWTVKARRMTVDQKLDLSHVVNELADWFAQS